MRSAVLIAVLALFASSAVGQTFRADASTLQNRALSKATDGNAARSGPDSRQAVIDLAALASDGAFFVRSSQRRGPMVPDLDDDAGAKGSDTVVINPRTPDNALAVALSGAWKRGFIEEGVEETRRVLLECQHETSVVLTTPLMRSDAQQAHCFRF